MPWHHGTPDVRPLRTNRFTARAVPVRCVRDRAVLQAARSHALVQRIPSPRTAAAQTTANTTQVIPFQDAIDRPNISQATWSHMTIPDPTSGFSRSSIDIFLTSSTP